MRPRLDRSRRTIARTLTTLIAILWASSVSAAPSGASPAAGTGTGTSATAVPLQRPAGMEPGPTTPPAKAPPPAEVGPQPQPPSLVEPSTPVAEPPPAAEPPASVTTATPSAPATTATPSEPTAVGRRRPSPELDDPKAPAALVAEVPPPKRFAHRGLVADFRLGTLGCLGGAMCRRPGQEVKPGVRLGGFIGGNVRGWFEAGLGGGWGTLTSTVVPGTNALLLYGLDPAALQQALLAQAAGLVEVDFAGLAVQEEQLRSAQVGPSVRVHLVPRGRVGAFVGSGVGYHLLRARYQIAAGAMSLDFHGIEVPVEANLSVYVLEHLAVGLQFDYMWTWYGVAVLDHPQQRVAVPMAVLQAAGQQQGVDLRAQLPQLWTLGLAIRGRL